MITGHDTPENVVWPNGVAYGALVDNDLVVIPAVDAFCQGYAEALLWANTYTDCPDCGDETRQDCDYENQDLSYAYISPGRWWEGIGIDFTDAIDFLAANFETMVALSIHCAPGSRLDMYGFWDCMGHDFALTRNGHGTGFWDRGYGDAGDILTDACKPYGEHNLYVDADDKIWNG